MTPVETIEFLRGLVKKSNELNKEICIHANEVQEIREAMEDLKQKIAAKDSRIETLTESKNILVHELDKAKNS
jgi:chromosome segregation ATPase